MSPGPRRLAVGVLPAPAHSALQRLLAALEEAFPVRFEPREDGGLRELDAVLVVGAEAEPNAADAGLPTLRLLAPEPSQPGETLSQRFASAGPLDRRLHGAELPDPRIAPALGVAERSPERATVLAYCGDAPTWTRRGSLDTALLAPAELGPDEALRERLCGGRSAALLPLVHFLRELTAGEGWQPPAPRATLLFDDPNLHWPSYGFVDLAALGSHARAHGYHAALAMVPLDAWYAHPKALRAMREAGGALSLVAHGNDHYGGELGRPREPGDALALTAQAMRRLRAFERRTGTPVDPVMVPPHEQCTAEIVAGLRRCGFEAITMTQPFPWLGDGAGSWLASPAGSGPLTGWRPADSAERLPVLLRHPLVGRSLPELTLRAFLDQPLILYGHQGDLGDGLDVLAAAVADVDRLVPARWCSLGEIAASGFETRRVPSGLQVRLLSRQAWVEIPADAETLEIAPTPSSAHPISTTAGWGPNRMGGGEELLVDGRPHRFDEPLPVTPGATVEVALRSPDAVDVDRVPAPRRRALAVPRRLLSEGRDRLAPLLSRAP
jgi:hypothetical protein